MATFKHKHLLILLSFMMAVLPFVADGQTAAQRERLLELSEQFARQLAQEKAESLRLADSLGWPVRQEFEDGRVIELMRVREDGMPMYYTTHNKGGGELINSDKVYPGGSAGLNLTGAGQTLGIWDSGKVRDTHVEFQTNGESRVTQRDGATSISDHATHVAGTMVAGGENYSAWGMSYQAYLDAYDWTMDLSGMPGAAADGLQVSQHSYGFVAGWNHNVVTDVWFWHGDISISQTEDYHWGFYCFLASLWDKIAFEAPNYLIVKSAGNDRNFGPPSQPIEHYYWEPDVGWTTSTAIRDLDGGEDGFKTTTDAATSKNIMVVGAVWGNGDMSNFSGWGPTDDGRIKPDIVAKGVDVYSTRHGSDTHYGFKGGTSMSGPMVSGSVGLLLEHQANLHPGEKLLASSIKALILHSADSEIGGEPGPDYSFGWGLMDTEAAVGIMTKNAAIGGNFNIREMTLNDQETIELTVYASGEEDLVATIVWTDPPGEPPPPSLNPTDLMLVNDLDMRLTSNATKTEYKPYILDPENPSDAATTGDNFRDNVEQIHVSEPENGEAFTLTITHKDDLDDDSQDFSLIITGITPTTYAGNNTNWHDPENWQYGSPEETEHIKIPAGLTHFPIITDEVVINNLLIESGASLNLAATASVIMKGNLVIQGSAGGKESEGELIIEAGGSLTVSGTFTTTAGNNAIVLKSDATASASLIHNTPGVQATVENYIAGGGTSWNKNATAWYYIAAPVVDQNIATAIAAAFPDGQTHSDFDLYRWSEAQDLWINYHGNDFDRVEFLSGEGYIFGAPASVMLSLGGELGSGDAIWEDLTYSGTGNTDADPQDDDYYTAGWHLLGNPFPSGIVATNTWTFENIVHTPKLWNGSTYDDVSDGFIPANTAFFVQVVSSTYHINNSLTIPFSARAHEPLPLPPKNAPQNRILLVAKAQGSEMRQHHVIRLEPDAAEGFDPRYDSRFMAGYAPQLFSITETDRLSTIAIPEITDSLVIPMVFRKNHEGENFLIKLERNMPNTDLYLHDLKTDLWHELDFNKAYTFTAGPDDDPIRFELHFSPPGDDDDPVSIREKPDQATAKLWYHSTRLYVQTTETGTHLTIYDINGRTLQTYRPEPGLHSYHINLPPGVYIARLNGNNSNETTKIIIQ